MQTPTKALVSQRRRRRRNNLSGRFRDRQHYSDPYSPNIGTNLVPTVDSVIDLPVRQHLASIRAVVDGKASKSHCSPWPRGHKHFSQLYVLGYKSPRVQNPQFPLVVPAGRDRDVTRRAEREQPFCSYCPQFRNAAARTPLCCSCCGHGGRLQDYTILSLRSGGHGQ